MIFLANPLILIGGNDDYPDKTQYTILENDLDDYMTNEFSF